MEIAFSEHIRVSDATSVGEARRAAQMAAQRLGFNPTRAGELALLATEVTRNVLVHGREGQVIVSGIKEANRPAARILALDKGPGIANLAEAMRDGYSTAGTPGGGMGAMKRIATSFEIFTGAFGTMVLLELSDAPPNGEMQIAGLAIPYPGERACGDEWAFHRSQDRLVVMIVDGLGHGPEAAEAAQEAVLAFRRKADENPASILGSMHDALKKTRGAVAAVAEIRPKDRLLTFAGVGNISGTLLGVNSSRSMVSHNGTLGVVTARLQEFHFDWEPKSVMVLHSDGLQSRWDLTVYPGLIVRPPALIAGALIRDFRRGRDDASVVVVKEARA